ncbi:amidohydrolase family protein [Vineibacter terrae]|uniref:amidohydrolase family protein n=1 Tax=Vineibacter terrae TaxID=2586908 RepID=UPI002E36F71B|nr:amidohydrolase family protein [Vineibacter terrae]HEX2890707.1 amidohydrolase family protein [Vineibacter terrae]
MSSPTIDAHQHFWDPARAHYPWMDDAALAPIRRAFGPGDLAPLLAANGVDASIVVQCRSSRAETEEFLAIAAAIPFVIGVVGWVDLTAADVGAGLDQLLSLPGGAKLVGIRHQVHDEADADWLSRADVRRGLQAVLARGLAYDLLVRTRELPAAIAAARDLPQGRFVLDHAAKPPIASGFDRRWAEQLAALAACPNVWCKISGLATEADWQDWDAARLQPYIAHAGRCFGADRLIFGSDWPVCLLAGSYAEIKAAAETDLAALGAEALRKARGANAASAYRLAIGETSC